VAVLDRLHQRIELGQVGRVGDHPQGALAEVGGGGLHPRLAAAGDDDVRALCGEAARGGETQAARLVVARGHLHPWNDLER